jgi:hypothetical protein
MVVLPPLRIDSTHDPEQSYLAYTEPSQADESLPIISNKDGQGGKREFAVFDDLELEFDDTLDVSLFFFASSIPSFST